MPSLKRKRKSSNKLISPSGCRTITNYFEKRPTEQVEVESSSDATINLDEESNEPHDEKELSDTTEAELIESSDVEILSSPGSPKSPLEIPKRKKGKGKTKSVPPNESIPKESPSPPQDAPMTRRKSARLAEKSRSIRSYFISDKPESDTTEEEFSSVEEVTPKRKKKKKQQIDKSPPVQEKPKIDEKTRAFLYSGLPEEIIQKQKLIEKKQEYNDWLDTMQYFPKYSYLEEEGEGYRNSSLYDLNLPTKFPIRKEETDELFNFCNDIPNEFSWIDDDYDENTEIVKRLGLACCNNKFTPSSKFKKFISLIESNVNLRDSVPWIEKYIPTPESLAVNSSSLEIFTNWLQSWKTDIDENDGLRRKMLPEKKKRKRRSSDSDFMASDSEEEYFCTDSSVEYKDKSGLKKKSVILYGPSGSGKTAMVYSLAKSFGFNVVEINFSSSRTGKEVMEQVEEATLSKQLKVSEENRGDASEDDSSNSASSLKSTDSAYAATQTSPHCLLLFEDLNLDDADAEDEGFFRAISQLIAASCRPIVMTISTPNTFNSYSSLEVEKPDIDPKIDRTDPLWIYCSIPTNNVIVNKVLLPILNAELEIVDESYKLNNEKNFQDFGYVNELLKSLVQHCFCDIRASINQLQFYWNKNWFGNFAKIHWNLNLNFKSQGFGFRQTLEEQEEQSLPLLQSQLNDNLKDSKELEMKNLDQMVTNLNLLTDFDCISTKELAIDAYRLNTNGLKLNHDLFKNLEDKIIISHSKLNPLNFYNTILYDSYQKQIVSTNIQKVNEQVSEYLDDPKDYDAISCIRTIIKTCILKSIDVNHMKRNGRVKYYFNRINLELINLIENTLDFSEIKKEAIQILENVSINNHNNCKYGKLNAVRK